MPYQMEHISPTALDAFSCRLQWYWGHLVKFRSLKTSSSLRLGVGIHHALEMYYGQHIDPVKAFSQWSDEQLKGLNAHDADDIQSALKMRALGIAMLESYVEHYKNEQFRVIGTETTMTRRLQDPLGHILPVFIHVRVDTIVQDLKLKKYFLLEHKTYTSFHEDQLDRDHQFVAQLWVAQKRCKFPLSGLIYNGLRKVVATRKSTTPLFERRVVNAAEPQMTQFLARATNMYRAVTAPDFTVFPEPNSMRCSFCGFKAPCTEYIKGGDFSYILNHNYSKKAGADPLEDEDANY